MLTLSGECKAIVVGAPSSGSGKTTFVAALARYLTKQGKQVRILKVGPDFIDPKFLELASGHSVYQLDFWMCGLEHCQELVARVAKKADIIIIEGVMGLFDGKCSTADIAASLNIPLALVINASSMAQTFGAIAHGLTNYRYDLKTCGVFANHVGSTAHAQMLSESLSEDLSFLGWLPKRLELEIPQRHLGLVQAMEISDLALKLDIAAKWLAKTLPDDFWDMLPNWEYTYSFKPTFKHSDAPLLNTTIAVACDAAFSFIYPANLKYLTSLGAKLVYFSPIANDRLPSCDAVYLPGGYPELYLEQLVANKKLIVDLKAHVLANLPVVAECGGMMYLNKTLAPLKGASQPLCAILDATSKMQPKLSGLGLVETYIDNYNIRGHCFHYSTTLSNEKELGVVTTQRGKQLSPVWQKNRVIASYVHWYFPSCKELVVRFFGKDGI